MGKTLQVDLFDGFTMRQTWNPVYGGNGATSPYAIEGAEAFVNRIRSILSTVLAIPNLSAVSIANELMPAGGKQGRLEFAAWYQKIVDEIFSLFLRFILSQTSSVNRVNRIVTLSMATLYPWKLDNYVDGFHFDETFKRTNDILVTMAGIYERLT